MGKARKGKRFAAQAVDPIGKAMPKTQEAGEEELPHHAEPDSVFERITSQIQDGSLETQECGLQSLAMFLSSATDAEPSAPKGASPLGLVASIRRHRLVRVVAPLILVKREDVAGDKSGQAVTKVVVATAALGALKNLSLVSSDICDDLVKEDIMTPLCALLSTFALVSPSEDSKRREMLAEAVSLLWNLCEANETALDIFNKDPNIMPALLQHLNLETDGVNVVVPALQCLFSVTEENQPAQEIVRANVSSLESLIGKAQESAISGAETLHAQLLAFGVLLNVGPEEKYLPTAIACISRVLQLDQRKMVNEYTSLCPLSEDEHFEEGVRNGFGNHSEEANGDEDQKSLNGPQSRPSLERIKKLEEKSQEINHTVLAQQTALEMLANLCCVEDDSEDDDQMEEDDDVDDEDMNGDTDSSSVGSSSRLGVAYVSDLPNALAEALKAQSIVSLVLAKANLPAHNVCQILTEAKRHQGNVILRMLASLRTKAFFCLNNLCGGLAMEDLGGEDVVVATWVGLGKLLLEQSCQSSLEGNDLAEAATTAMRALTQKLVDCTSAASLLNSLTVDDLRTLLEFGAKSTHTGVRINLVQVAGGLGHLLMRGLPGAPGQPGTPDAHAQSAELIGQFLLEAAARDVSLRVVAEALDKIFDMFGEDDAETSRLAEKVQLVRRLQQMLPGLKTKMGLAKAAKGRKKLAQDEEDFGVISMAKTNLVRFIKYKEKNAAK